VADTLEVAAHDTLQKLRGLGSQVEKAHERFAALGQKLQETAHEVEADWSRLAEQVGSFLQKVDAEQGRLTGHAQASAQALSTLDHAVDQARADGQGALDDGRELAQSFGEQATGTIPSVTAFAESVQSSFQSLGEQAQAVETQLEEAVNAARTFLEQEVVQDLHEMQSDVEDHGRSVTEALATCGRELEASYDEWEAGLDEVESTIEEAFGEARAHLPEMVDEAFDHCAQKHVDELEPVSQQLAELAQVLQGLREAAERCADDTDAAAGALEEGLVATRGGLEAVEAKLGEVRGLLARYTFVQA
jgi:DNA anti-recombination protein RmuC